MFIIQPLSTLAGSSLDASIQSKENESLMSEEVLCVSEYAEDIYRHLRENEVRNYLNHQSWSALDAL